MSEWRSSAAHDGPQVAVASPQRLRRPRPPPSARCCIGTTRCCRRRSSTSPASRRSWTCNWCRVRRRGPPKPRPARHQHLAAGPAVARRAPGHGREARAGVGGRGGRHGQLNERDVSIVQSRTTGFVERVYGRAPGDVVAAGAPLVDVLLPEWLAAQQEYLAVRATGDAALTAASRQRLVLLGMPAALIEAVAQGGRPQAVQTITAPSGGVIAELMVRQGMTVAAGMTLARINGLGTVWLEAAVPEVQGATVAPGQGARGAPAGAAGRGVARQGRRRAARSQPRHAHVARAHRVAQPGPAPARGHVRAGHAGRRGARRGAGGAGRGRDPHRQARPGLRARRARALPPGRGARSASRSASRS